jgi:hypothetical protein
MIEIAQARALVRDLFEHSARIYWTDFILTMLVAYGAVALYLSSPVFSLPCFIGFTVAAFALLRCGVFIHEIAHMPRGRMPPFPGHLEHPIWRPGPDALLHVQESR